MFRFILRRLLYAVPTVIAVSVIAFFVIALPPGDYVDYMARQLASAGDVMTQAEMDAMRSAYGLDQPLVAQYFRWISDIVLRGDFGFSYQWKVPVSDLIWERLSLTTILAVASLVFVWIIAIPIGIYSAVRRYSLTDYAATFLGFFGLAIPNFLLALALMYVAYAGFGQNVGGLFSPQYLDQPWSWAKFVDFLGHLWIPMVVLSLSGTASVIRIIRANLADELPKPYVMAARAKGLPEMRLLAKYPVRQALNPFVSGLNDVFVDIISGSTIVSVVLGLQTTGPLLLDSLQTQDMNMAASFILVLSLLGVVGTLVSDLLLAWLDPRIRYQQG